MPARSGPGRTRPDRTTPRRRPPAPVLIAVALPVLLALAVLWLVQDAVRQTSAGRRTLSWPVWPLAGRALLCVLFVTSAARLVDEVAVLT